MPTPTTEIFDKCDSEMKSSKRTPLFTLRIDSTSVKSSCCTVNEKSMAPLARNSSR